MFSKLMKKTIAAVAMLAMASAFAGVTTEWWNINFDNIEDGGKLSGVAGWTQETDDESSVQGGVLNLNTQGKDLKWTPSENTEKFDSVILDADVTFVASDVEPTTDDDMQTAIYLKAKEDGTNVLCAWGKDNGTAKWIELFDGSNLAEGKYDVNITINYTADVEPMVKIIVGDMVDEYPAAIKKETVSSVAFRGTGFVDNFKGEKYLEKTYVASVGDQQFEKYADALEYLAANGGVLTITGDSDEELSFGTFTFNGVDATIDLNGKEITAAFVVDGGANLTIDNGTVNAPMGSDVIYIKNGTAVVGANATLYASDNCVVYLNDATPTSELNLVVSGNLYVTNDTGYAAIYGNGLNEAESNIEIKDGATVKHDFDLAIYHAQVGTLKIGYATIVGTTAIEMRAGNLIVNEDAFIEGTADFSATPNGNGSTVLGAAIALSQHTTQKPTTVTVNGGTLKGDRAFYQDNLASGTSTSVSATIAAGTTLDGAIEVAEEGFVMPKADDGSYTLAAADFVVAGKPYDTFADAYANAAEGATIEVYTDFSATEIITIAKGITIDGNGHTLESTAARAINIDTTGAVVINDLTINAGERAINIINKPATVTLTGVTATADNNAVMIATSADAAKVTVENCDFTGLAVINVAGAGAQVTVDGSKITNVDANADENYGAITVWTSAEGATVEVTNSEIVVDDDSVKAFVFPGDATVTGVDKVTYCVATVGDAGYDTIEEAVQKAKAGETIVLVRDITASEIITINKDITFDGNGHTLTSTAPRAINVDGADGATIENLTIVAEGERGINLINGATNVTIDNVDVTAANYAVNLAASASGAVVIITDSTLTGLNAFNAGAANAEVTIADSEIYCNDNSSEYYGAISLNQDAAGTKVVVTDSQFYIKDDSVVAINGASGKGATITIDGSSDAVTSMVAAIDDANGYSNLFTTLAGAFAEADAGETVKLIANASEDVTIAATATLDLNGFAATGSTFTLTDTAAKLYVAEDCLTVETSVDGYEVVFADGCYSVQKQVVVVEFAPVKTTSIAIVGDEAILTIDSKYTEVEVYFKATLDAEFGKITPTSFENGVITVPAETDTGFFTVHAK